MRPGFVVFLLGVVLTLFGGNAAALPPDPAARGLDLYVHAAPRAAPGALFEVNLKAYGFPTVTRAVPLADAAIEVGWDPEALDGEPPPPTVHATTDGEGRARIAIVVPYGKNLNLQLLVSVRHGEHARTRQIPIERASTTSIELHVADLKVVPSSTVSAWIRVVGATGEPLAKAKVTVSLLEGGLARHEEKLVTDRGGLALARVPIPPVTEPSWSWTLQATVATDYASDTATLTLTPREETPGTPSIEVEWIEPPLGARPGDRIAYRARARDATGQPILDQPIEVWVGAQGTTPPQSDQDWARVGKRVTTDGAGEINGTYDAPTLVRAGGTAGVIVARSLLEGRMLQAEGTIAIGLARLSATVQLEAPAVVPGLEQRVSLTVASSTGEGVPGTFVVRADGLDETVTTNADGEAELSWKAPTGVGGHRDVGPCAGGVAAALTVRPVDPAAFAKKAARSKPRGTAVPPEAFTVCVPVDRDAAGIVRVTPSIARPGERVAVTIDRAGGRYATKSLGASSVILSAVDRPQSATGWLLDKGSGKLAGEVSLPDDAASGLWTVSSAHPESSRAARVLASRVLVVPRTLPSLTARVVGGRATPGGAIEVEARLTNGHGHGLPGTISAIVVDAFGGGNASVDALDTRTRLCRSVNIDDARCGAVLERDPSTEALRRGRLGSILASTANPIVPLNDPGAHASVDLDAAFREVLHSLEGAVLEATADPQRLLDTRRKQNGRWVFNPELLTLVTEAMDEPPVTPGGERLVLDDLIAVDPQVSFDTVARRISRLKLFTVLAAVRTFRIAQAPDPAEPVFRDPNALLRRLVRDQTLSDSQLLDPWGGTIQYIAVTTPAPAPLLSMVHGFELRAPGPDGIVGTADDVRDPFERVVRSGSAYARAVQEDRIVDAKWDVRIAEDSIRSWEALFAELTGRELGNGSGAGLGAVGEGGGGRGVGIGLGSVGTIGNGHGRLGRSSAGISTGEAHWTLPTRTDAEGRLLMTVPLGSAETTWKVELVGVPDGAGPASTSLSVASDLPLSTRFESGARWIVGDDVETQVLVRNRTGAPLHASLDVKAEGVVTHDATTRGAIAIDVPAHGARTVPLRLRANAPGEARVVIVARAPGVPDDTLVHTWEAAPAGEPRALTQTAWVDGERGIEVGLDYGYATTGTPKLVLERGYTDAVLAALESLDPDRLASPADLLDALETGARIQRWASTKDTPRHKAVALIARRFALRSLGRYNVTSSVSPSTPSAATPPTLPWLERARASSFGNAVGQRLAAPEVCPPDWYDPHATGFARFDTLDLEPEPGSDVPPCWGAYTGTAASSLTTETDPEGLAHALLAIVDRPHHTSLAATVANRLRHVVRLERDGDLVLQGPASGYAAATNAADRARRAVVYAALLRAQRFGASATTETALFARIARLRDVTGGYGSSAATLAVVRALVASQLEPRGTTRARVTAPGGFVRDVIVPESGFVDIDLPSRTLDVNVATSGAPVVARFERPVLRSWSRPSPSQASPIALEIAWPDNVKPRTAASINVSLRHMRSETVEVDARIPLPPGVTLAAAIPGVSQLQGFLVVRSRVDLHGAVLTIPVRFGLAGSFTLGEARAHLARSSSGTAVAPARPLTVR